MCIRDSLKAIAVGMEVEGPKRLTLKEQGPKAVTAGDIVETNGISILNKDAMICQLDEGGSLDMELTVDTGKGYRALANINEHGGQEVPHLHFHLFGGEPVGKMVQ